MGQPLEPAPALLYLGVLWSSEAAWEAARAAFCGRFGQPFLWTPPEPFEHTAYYEAEMGSPIFREYLFFAHLLPPAELADAKLWTNRLEHETGGPAGRRVNLDPGYLALDKLVLATTKDRSHRIHIGNGIYAESTLQFYDGGYRAWPWTYPDYARPVLAPVFTAARKVLKRLLRDAQDVPTGINR